MTIVYASPPRPSIPVAPEVAHLGMTWEGPDGSRWDMGDWRGGVFFTAGGIEGLDDPPWRDYTSSSPAVAGQTPRGGRDLPRPVFWPVGVFSDASSQQWVNLNRQWWRSLSRTEYGRWTVTQPSGEKRWLECRRAVTGGHSFVSDPSARRWEVYGIPLVADWPYWRGDPVVRPFTVGDPDARDYVDPTTLDEVYFISKGQTIATASIPNPGDVSSWLTWTAEAGATGMQGVVLGVGTQLIGLTVDLDPGDVLTVDTRRQTTTLNGVRARGLLNPHEFTPVQPGASVPLNIAATGSGTITAELVPDYWWAM